MAELYDKNGNPIPDDQQADAVANGQAFARKGSRINMLDDGGAPVTVAAEELAQAIQAGFTPESSTALAERRERKQFGSIGQQALAGVEGAARGATLGLSDVALTGVLGDDYRQAAATRQRVNPLTSGVGEVGGAIAPLLASGGSSLAARGVATLGAPTRGVAAAGRGIESLVMGSARALGYEGTTIAGRMAARATALGAAGTAEGAMYGAGQAVSRAALDDTDLTAEKVLASMGQGALYGGLAGGALGAGGGLVTGLGRKVLGGRTVREAARQVAYESALNAIGARGSDLRRLVGRKTGEAAGDKIAKVGQELLEYRFKSGPLQGQKLFRAARKAEDFADDLTFAKREIGEELGVVREQVDAIIKTRPDLTPNVSAWLKRVDDEVIAPLKASKSPTVRAQAERVEKELADLRAPPSPVDEIGVANANFLRSGMRQESTDHARSLFDGKTAGEVDELARTGRAIDVSVFPDEQGAANVVLQDGRHYMLAAKDAGAESINARVKTFDAEGNLLTEQVGPVSIQPKRGPSFAELEQVRRDLRSVFQPPRPAGGGLPAPVPEHAQHLERAERMLSDYLDEAAERALRETGQDSSVYRQLKNQFSAFADLEKIANKAALQDLGNRAISPSDYATGLATAIGALASGNVAGIGYGIGASIAHKLIRERGRSVIAVMADNVANFNGRLDGSARALAGLTEAPKRLTPVAAVELQERFERASESVKQFQANPTAAVTALAEPVRDIAQTYPTLAASVQRKIAGDMAYLARHLPQPVTRAGNTLTPRAVKPTTAATAKREFVERFEALNEPATVIEDLTRGEWPKAGLEALKERRPEVFQELRSLAIRYTSEREEELPFKRRMLLSLAFDFNGDWSLENVATIQQSMAPAEEAGEPPGPAPQPSLSPKMAEENLLPEQRAAGGM